MPHEFRVATLDPTELEEFFEKIMRNTDIEDSVEFVRQTNLDKWEVFAVRKRVPRAGQNLLHLADPRRG